MEDAVGRAEFEEYKNRIEQEDHRQNGRIKELEESTKQINALTVSIEHGQGAGSAGKTPCIIGEPGRRNVAQGSRLRCYCDNRYRSRIYFHTGRNVGGKNDEEN